MMRSNSLPMMPSSEVASPAQDIFQPRTRGSVRATGTPPARWIKCQVCAVRDSEIEGSDTYKRWRIILL